MRSWMLIGAATLLGACVTELDLPEPEPLDPAAQTQPSEFRYIVPHIDRPQVELPDPPMTVDPCDCDDMACLDEWAHSELSCDVCVVLLCDDEWHPHVCNHC